MRKKDVIRLNKGWKKAIYYLGWIGALMTHFGIIVLAITGIYSMMNEKKIKEKKNEVKKTYKKFIYYWGYVTAFILLPMILIVAGFFIAGAAY